MNALVGIKPGGLKEVCIWGVCVCLCVDDYTKNYVGVNMVKRSPSTKIIPAAVSSGPRYGTTSWAQVRSKKVQKFNNTQQYLAPSNYLHQYSKLQ